MQPARVTDPDPAKVTNPDPARVTDPDRLDCQILIMVRVRILTLQFLLFSVAQKRWTHSTPLREKKNTPSEVRLRQNLGPELDPF